MNKAKKQNGFVRVVRAYFSDFGLRQITAIGLIVSSIVALVGVCVPNEITILVGLYLYAVCAILGMIAAALVMFKVRNRRAPQFKRALIALVVLVVVFALALAGIIVTHVNGIYQ